MKGGRKLDLMRCDLKLISLSPHVSQIVTGFLMLQKMKIVDLNINFVPEHAANYPTPHMIEAVIDNKIKISYDMLDGYNFANQNIDNYLKGIDCYFKRSYNLNYHQDFACSARIFPLGFNYHVTTKGNILDYKLGKFSMRNAAALLYRNIVFGRRLNAFHTDHFEDMPHIDNETLVLFLTRPWDPEEDPNFSAGLKEERHYINNMRVSCIRKLREVFGSRFIGGFSPLPYAIERFPDCVVDGISTKRYNFLQIVKKASICVATMGLHESNGWRLAEYIAASKAIVSEKLHYSVPGKFNCNENYLEFNNADQCVEQAMKLDGDKQLAYKMKLNNYYYYHNYLRPDRLVFNTLVVAFNHPTQ